MDIDVFNIVKLKNVVTDRLNIYTTRLEQIEGISVANKISYIQHVL